MPGIARSSLTPAEAREEIEVLLLTSIVLYPVEKIVRLSLYATAAFRLNWFDAHLWAYAEHYRCSTIATACIEWNFELLHRDRDFEPLQRTLGLRVAME